VGSEMCIRDRFYSSEINDKAIKVAKANHPDIIHLGDVTNWEKWNLDWSKVDVLKGGSPCQGFSLMGKQLAFNDPRSKLFFVYMDILNHIKKVNPNVLFLLENVKMKKDYRDIITAYIGVQPLHINSSLLSAQNRERYYWTNIPGVTVPEDKKIYLDSIIPGAIACGYRGRKLKKDDEKYTRILTIRKDGKSNCLVTAISATGCYIKDNEIFRLTPEQAEQLQTLPIGYTDVEGISSAQRFKMIGNGWTVDVIKHIFKSLPK
jgi:site-specific DNA-cytosine methylase